MIPREEPSDLEGRLQAVLDARYHNRHPFNLRMHAGALQPDEIRAWVLHRYYYQTRIPIKDGRILSKAEDPLFRREWVERIHDHDGRRPGEGGLALWLALAGAVGLDRDEVEGLHFVCPAAREACDAYVRFVESNDLLASVAASLTERAAGEIMGPRIAAFEKHYTWVDPEGLEYFRTRTVQAPRDAHFGMDYVTRHARSAKDAERCVEALETKCSILWSFLDALEDILVPLRQSPHALQRFDERNGCAMLVLPERAVELNASAEHMLALCNGEHDAYRIALAIGRAHPDAPQAADDAYRFLAEMRALGALVPAS